MIQNGKREKKIFSFFSQGKRIDLKKKDFESTEKSKIISETIYSDSWKHFFNELN